MVNDLQVKDFNRVTDACWSVLNKAKNRPIAHKVERQPKHAIENGNAQISTHPYQ